MNEWMGYFCAGSVLVNFGLTFLVFKLYTEFWKERVKK